MMTTTDDRLLALSEVAERLRVGVVTVRRRIKDGSLKALRAGTANRTGYRVYESELRRFIDAMEDAHGNAR